MVVAPAAAVIKVNAAQLSDTFRGIESRARSLARYTATPRFRECVEDATDADMQALYQLVVAIDANGVKAWMESISGRDTSEAKFAALRTRARELAVPGLYNMDRNQLIQAIAAAERTKQCSNPPGK